MKTPFVQEAEMCLLGAAMIFGKPQELRAITETVNPDWLYLPAHRTLFATLQVLAAEGKVADLVTVKYALGDKLKSVGGTDYLIQLGESVPSPHNWRHYADICEAEYIRRTAICRAKDIAIAAESGDTQSLLQAIQAIGQGLFRQTTDTAWIADVLPELEKSQSGQGIRSGFRSIDEATACYGLPRNEPTYIFADTNKGKTAMMGRLVLNIAGAGHTCGWATFEMGQVDLTRRLMKHLCGWSEPPIKSFEERAKWDDAIKELEFMDRDLAFYDASEKDSLYYVEDLCEWATMMHRAHHMEALFVDYVQLLCSRHRTSSEREDLQLVSRYLKSLARRTGMAIIIGAQVTKSKDDSLTAMGSRRFEQDAGLVIEVDCDRGGRIGKNRHGVRNVEIPIRWNPHLVTFEESI